MNLKKLIVPFVFATGLVLGGVATGVPDWHGPAKDAPISGEQAAISGGCIRLTANGPRWHENTRHNTVGVDTRVQPTINASGQIEFKLAQTLDVVSLTVVGDETLASKGVWVGGSSGTGNVKITLRKNGGSVPFNLNRSKDYRQVQGDFSNIWFTVVSVAGTE